MNVQNQLMDLAGYSKQRRWTYIQRRDVGKNWKSDFIAKGWDEIEECRSRIDYRWIPGFNGYRHYKKRPVWGDGL